MNNSIFEKDFFDIFDTIELLQAEAEAEAETFETEETVVYYSK